MKLSNLEHLLIISTAFFTSVAVVQADCCYDAIMDVCAYDNIHKSNTLTSYRCGDCSYGTPYCGYRHCLISGCKCSGGCRQATCMCCKTTYFQESDYDYCLAAPETRSLDNYQNTTTDVRTVISYMDTNGDRMVDLHELFTWVRNSHHPDLNRLSNYYIEEEFLKMDADGNGYVTAEEMD